jgi:hypothetical protein
MKVDDRDDYTNAEALIVHSHIVTVNSGRPEDQYSMSLPSQEKL